MLTVNGFLAGALALLFLAGCAGDPPSTAGDETAAGSRQAEEAAAAALAAMDNGGSPPSAAGSRQSAGGSGGNAGNTGSTAGAPSAAEPRWVRAPDQVYNRALYVAAVGYGADRSAAEKNALTALTAIFGQTIEADQKVTITYSEAVLNGASQWAAENTDIENAVRTSVSMNSLVGAEIKDVWFDGKATHYAVAVMDKAQTARLYREMIRVNLGMISNLTAIPPSEKNSMEGLARYYLAATVADANRAFADVLSVIGETPPAELRNGDEYRLEAAAITRTIPVGVNVSGDRSGRIRAAFAEALAAAGFRTGGTNARYLLQVSFSLTEVKLNNPNKFIRYLIDGNLIDTSSGEVLFPYNVNDREGHLSIPEAEERAFRAAEGRIKNEYGGTLSAFLARLIPNRERKT
ncbi:MAG: LPP20 family lipoprotein [Spirochaetaceae bacterium]|jgi:hypothetical protein|nr:LPP20 family lipoprotein [Spirochaetaceae bacterium]